MSGTSTNIDWSHGLTNYDARFCTPTKMKEARMLWPVWISGTSHSNTEPPDRLCVQQKKAIVLFLMASFFVSLVELLSSPHGIGHYFPSAVSSWIIQTTSSILFFPSMLLIWFPNLCQISSICLLLPLYNEAQIPLDFVLLPFTWSPPLSVWSLFFVFPLYFFYFPSPLFVFSSFFFFLLLLHIIPSACFLLPVVSSQVATCLHVMSQVFQLKLPPVGRAGADSPNLLDLMDFLVFPRAEMIQVNL